MQRPTVVIVLVLLLVCQSHTLKIGDFDIPVMNILSGAADVAVTVAKGTAHATAKAAEYTVAGVKKAKDAYQGSSESAQAVVDGAAVTAVSAGTAGVGVSIAGFSSIGPVAGSVAAGWQASMGAVAAGSWFATLQSAAMTTVAGVAGAPVLIGGAVVGATAYGAYKTYKYMYDEEPSDNKNNS